MCLHQLYMAVNTGQTGKNMEGMESMAKFCKNCGAAIDDNARFCAGCGGQVAASAPGGQTSAPPPSQQAPGSSASRFTNYSSSTADEDGSIDPADIEKNKAMGGLAYFIFFLPLLACPDSNYGRFHANQGLLLLILGICSGIVNAILTVILTWRLGWLSLLLGFIIGVAVFVIGVIGLINGFTGKVKELPLVGKIRIIKTK